MVAMNVMLISTYELGHQPFGLASPAAWLRARGAQVTCLDLSRESLREQLVREADLVAFYVPMHTATRLAIQLVEVVRKLNPRAHLCFYGLYAPVNEAFLRELGVQTILGGEFEGDLAALADWLGARRIEQSADEMRRGNGAGGAREATTREAPIEMQTSGTISLERLAFTVPDRAGLPPLREYAHLMLPDGGHLVAGYTEASRGCKHLCRHCPIVPVYNGAFRIVQRDVVLGDIRQQVAAGAEHISFGDPDFFNGPGHAIAIVESLHREFPKLTYDVTIKVEHLLKHGEHLATLRDTGCLFVTTAVEAVDDAILARLDKGHTRADFVSVIARFRELGMTLQPTFVPFTPWTTLAGYRELLALISAHDLVENIAPIQLGIRLLIPAGSRLLELEEITGMISPFDAAALFYPWRHADARLDALAERVQALANEGDKAAWSRTETFARIWAAASEAAGETGVSAAWRPAAAARPRAIPHFTEPWYCCAEPTKDQFVSIARTVKPEPPRQRGGVRPDAFL